MTSEEKIRAYDKAIKEASAAYKDEDKHLKATLERIFPELKESEDERIRKELLEHCKNQAKPYIQTGNKCPQIQSWIAWLEKQGEKKPVEENKGNIGEISPNWSEEDEKEMAAIEHHLNNCGASITSILWLKSLKGRVGCEANCTTIKEWSEEEIEKAAQEWDSKANFNPFYMTMENGKPTGVKQSITTHKESFKAGIYWILKSLNS